MSGLVVGGVYVPRARLARSAITAALGTAGAARGWRSVASYDEDTTTLAVEAARGVVAGGEVPDVVLFATGAPVYLDKSCASTVHAALGLPAGTAAHDLHGSVRSAIGGLRAALDAAAGGRTALLVLSDVRTGRPGSADESTGGDAGAALLFSATAAPVVELVAAASATEEVVERWRGPGDHYSRVWEDRFGESVHVPRATDTVQRALDDAGLTLADVDHLVLVGLHERSLARLCRLPGLRSGVLADHVTRAVGNTGGTRLGLELLEVLDRAAAGDTVLVVSVADGADALVLRVTDEVARRRPTRRVLDVVAETSFEVDYPTFLSWRGFLVREPPRRPDPAKPSSPASQRTGAWKYSFSGSACDECGTRHLPPARVCQRCHAVDRMTPVRLADTRARVATFTVDHLAASPSPPFLAAVVDFDGGGRSPVELTDVRPADLGIGQQVEMTFRHLYAADGVRNYFWKGRPVIGSEQESTS